MSKTLVLILFILGLWIAIVLPKIRVEKSTKYNTSGYSGNSTSGGKTHSSGGGSF